MAYINGKETCFSPSLTLEASNAVLQELKANDMPSGDATIYPPQGVDGFSSVKVMGAYFTENDDVYTRIFRVRKDYSLNYDDCAHLEKVIFDRSKGVLVINGYNRCAELKEIEFVDGCNVYWDAIAFDGSPIETIRFGAIDIESYINIWGMQPQYFTNVTNVEIMGANWLHSLAFFCSPLTVESLQNIINHLGTATDGQTLWLGDENLAKLSNEYIEAATAKGWSLM